VLCRAVKFPQKDKGRLKTGNNAKMSIQNWRTLKVEGTAVQKKQGAKAGLGVKKPWTAVVGKKVEIGL